MNLFELNEPSIDVVLFLNENKHDPRMALAEASVRFGMPTEEILAIYRRHLVEKKGLKELFDKPLPAEEEEPDYFGDGPAHTFKFQTGSAEYKLTIDHDSMGSGNWLVNFYIRTQDGGWSPDQTNSNQDQFKVFSTVINVLVKVFSKVKLVSNQYIEFFATGDSRIKLYQRIGQTLANKLGLRLSTQKVKGGTFSSKLKNKIAGKGGTLQFMLLPKAVAEGEVIDTKFTQKLATKKGMYYNPDLEPPVSLKNGKPFDRFELKTHASGRTGSVIGVQGDYREVCGTSTLELATVLAKAYNAGGYTDQKVEKVRLGESEESQVPQAIVGALAPYVSDFSTAIYDNKWEVQFEWEGETVELDFASPDGKIRLFACNDACPEEMWESIQKYLDKHHHMKQFNR